MITLTTTYTRPDANTTMGCQEAQWLTDQTLQTSYYTHLNTTYINSGLATRTFENIDALNYKTVMVFNNIDAYQNFKLDSVLKELWAARDVFLTATGQTVVYEVTGIPAP